MAKRLNLMVSKLASNLVLLFCTLTIMSCNDVQTKDVSNEKEILKMQNVQPINKVKFLPDSTVNEILRLNNPESAENFYPNISTKQYITHLRESPVLGFKNISNSEYLLLYQYEGGLNNGFSCFEIGKINDLEEKLTVLDYDSFKTESGLMLGISLKELENIKGSSYSLDGNKVVYQLTDYLNSSFLRIYNMPGYFLECTLMDDKIIKIKFGFEYP